MGLCGCVDFAIFVCSDYLLHTANFVVDCLIALVYGWLHVAWLVKFVVRVCLVLLVVLGGVGPVCCLVLGDFLVGVIVVWVGLKWVYCCGLVASWCVFCFFCLLCHDFNCWWLFTV